MNDSGVAPLQDTVSGVKILGEQNMFGHVSKYSWNSKMMSPFNHNMSSQEPFFCHCKAMERSGTYSVSIFHNVTLPAWKCEELMIGKSKLRKTFSSSTSSSSSIGFGALISLSTGKSCWRVLRKSVRGTLGLNKIRSTTSPKVPTLMNDAPRIQQTLDSSPAIVNRFQCEGMQESGHVNEYDIIFYLSLNTIHIYER